MQYKILRATSVEELVKLVGQYITKAGSGSGECFGSYVIRNSVRWAFVADHGAAVNSQAAF